MSNKPKIVIVGGGHAGIEAAFAASKFKTHVYLVTMDKNSLGRMSCNPAIGGLAKGHLVKEIDALGGIMGYAADLCTIQSKTLNTSKGRAVWSPRSQIDKIKYSNFINNFINNINNIEILEDEVVDFNIHNNNVSSVFFKNSKKIEANALIICTGTFMNGTIHMGSEKYFAGRLGEKPSSLLTNALKQKGFVLERLKTGTPPRLLSDSISWQKLQSASGDPAPVPFSVLTKRPYHPKHVPCYVVETNNDVHSILKNNLSKSAIYSGIVEGIGPRYCPSIEDKVVRFAEKNSHQLFLEPEWFGSNQIYINGFSTSMPKDVQKKALRKIIGLENVEFIRYGYAIEYDYFPTYQLKSTLETKNISGLYFAGQLNGTSGYEEAAAQGLIAGANSALKVLNKKPLLLSRNEAYIGVLIDDLITKKINEPYRMFTSSAEHRLFLRPDNAPQRLTKKGFSAGIVKTKQYNIFKKYLCDIENIRKICKSTKYIINKSPISVENFIKRPESSIYNAGLSNKVLNRFSKEAIFAAETEIKYEGYIKIESRRIEKIKKMNNIKIPTFFNYKNIKNISSESKEKLNCVRPETLGQASRIAGVRPSDVAVLAMCLKFYE